MSDNNTIEVEVLVEDEEQFFTLRLTPNEVKRASHDNDYLQLCIRQQQSQVETQTGKENSPQEQVSASQSSENSTASLFIWSTPCVLLLLTLYEEYADVFKTGMKRHKAIWDEIATKLREKDSGYVVSGSQCQTKLNGLKRTYKKIIDHNNISGNDRASWTFFERMDEIFGATGWSQPSSLASEAGPSSAMSTVNTNSNTTPQKRKIDVVFQNCIKDMKEDRRKRDEEKERYRLEKSKKREENFQRLLEMKERLHNEKMELMRQLLDKS